MSFLVTENSSDLASIARYYEVFFGEEADPNGLAFWAEALENGDADLDDIAQAFGNQRAFVDRFDGDLSDDAFMRALYTWSYGRDPDAEGGTFWVEALAAGVSRADVAAAFAASEEGQQAIDVVGDAGLFIPDFAAPTFGFGVASGDPAADSVVIWTHARPEGTADGEAVTVQWEVSTDPEFGSIVATGEGTTSSARDYTFQAIPEGLEAGETYYYRFTVGDETSMTGTTRTLPEGELDALTLAIFSCSNYPAGFFNAYDAAVERGDFDFAVHLGDYIYEDAFGGFATENAEAFGRVPSPLNEIITVEDYSERYAQYHTDADLVALRASTPIIHMWDDHETADNSWTDGAVAHDPATEGDWEAREAAALEAHYWWMPRRVPESGDLRDADTSYTFGDLVTLHMLETRLQARDQTYSNDPFAAVTARGEELFAIDGTGEAFIAEALALGLVPDTFDLSDPAQFAALLSDEAFVAQVSLFSLVALTADPEREMIGDQQLAEFGERLAEADTVWDVIGSQTLMTSQELPSALLLDQSPENIGAFLGILEKTATGEPLTPEEEALINSGAIPFNYDSWDGYKAEREAIVQLLLENDANAIVLAGDTHNSWAGSVNALDGTFAAYEFGGPGVSAPGLEVAIADLPPEIVAQLFTGFIPTLDYAETQSRGYMEVTFTPEAVSTEYVFTEVDRLDYTVTTETRELEIDVFA